MHSFIDAALDRYRTVLLLLVFILIAGSISYMNIPKESSPDVKIPIIYVSMSLEGISPEDGERLLIRPMEKKLSTIEGVKKMSATASEGQASVILEFDAGFNSDKALQDVRTKVDEAKAELPQDADEPSVNEVNFSLFPIVNVILTGDVPERVLVKVARSLRDKLQNISTVLEANIAGGREEVVEIVLNPRTLESYGLSPAEVFAQVQNNNVLVAAGEIDNSQGRYSVKLPGLIEGVRELRDIPIKRSGDAVVTLKDVAELKRTFKDQQSYARVNGTPAVVVSISKRSGANIIETVEAVKEIVAQEQAFLPSGINVTYSGDVSNETKDMLADLQNGLILAVLLVFVIMIWMMGVRTALFVSLAIPGSFLIGILALDLMGMTLNIVVLFSLILAVGMLVDAAIVVCEYADRLMIDGVPPSKAYGQAAKRMVWPVIAATLTTKVVFLPLLFWPGVVGQFMKYMPITLIVTLLGSLLMAMVFVPVIGTRYGKRYVPDADTEASIRASEEGDMRLLKPFSRGYVGLLDALLNHPGKVTLSMLGLLVVIYAAFAMFGKGVEFFPDIEPTNANVLIRARGNLSVSEKDTLVKQVESRIMDMKEVRVFFAKAGNVGERDIPEDTIGIIQLEFVDWRDRRKADLILKDIVSRTKDVAGIIVEANKQENGPPVGKAVQLEFASRDPDKIAPEVRKMIKAINEIGGFANIQDDLPIPQIEWKMQVDRELAGKYNLDIRTIGNVVKLVTNGIKVGEYRPNDADDEVDIIVRFPVEYRNLSQLDMLKVPSAQGLVPVSNFVTRSGQQKVGTLQRVDERRVITIKSDLQPGILADDQVKKVKAYFEKNPPDPEVSITFRGEDEEQKKNSAFLGGAFLIAIFAMTVIMVTQFNSIYSALVIMSAVVFSTVGVFLALIVTGQPFGIVMCGVGIIALAGIVVNNNIIFIDTFDILKAQGMEFREALLRTGAQRLRPILLTAGTTVLGLIPMMLGLNINFATREVTIGAPSSQWWTQLSTAIAGGLTFATILTLFFTPCLLLMAHQIGRKWKNK